MPNRLKRLLRLSPPDCLKTSPAIICKTTMSGFQLSALCTTVATFKLGRFVRIAELGAICGTVSSPPA